MSRECSYANKLDPNIGRRIANEHRSTFAFDAKTSEKKKNNNDNNNSRKHVRFKYQFPRFL